jgi:hypothetical protein
VRLADIKNLKLNFNLASDVVTFDTTAENNYFLGFSLNTFFLLSINNFLA